MAAASSHRVARGPGERRERDSAGERRYFDTRRPGKSAAGHDFADVLDDDQKQALLEYLKTL